MGPNDMDATRADRVVPTVLTVEVFEDQGDLILENAIIAVVEVGVDGGKAGVVAAENSVNLVPLEMSATLSSSR